MNVGGMSGIRTRRLRLLKAVKSPHKTNWVEFTYDALVVVSASSPVNTSTEYGTAMRRCTSGTPAGSERMTADNTTSLTLRLGALRKRASYR